MASAENRPRHEPQGPGESLADDLGGRQPGRCLREPAAAARMRAAAIIMTAPHAKNPPQGLLAEGSQAIQTLATQTAA